MQPPPTRLTHEAVQSPYTRSAAAARLELTIEREAGKACTRTVVLEGELLRIGSHESNELVIDDPTVSRFHCRLVHDRPTALSVNRTAWRIVDESSLNGTTLGGLRIRDVDLPEGGCKLQLGDSVVRIRELPAENSIELLARASFGDLVGNTVPMHRLFAVLERVANSGSNVLIEGESGTGKEMVATELVRRGPRARKPFVIVDCSTIAPAVMEGELFGHAAGVFGSKQARMGAFEAAQGGTVFFDEVGELPLELQPKVLRALEAHEIRRVGETAPRKVDVRVVAATNRKLEREVNNARFREDLFFRLSAVTVRVPALRERFEDIELLVDAFLDALQASHAKHLFRGETLATMMRHEWPGNVRELRNYVERTLAFQDNSGTSPAESQRTQVDAAVDRALARRPSPPVVDAVPRRLTPREESSAQALVDARFKNAKERVVAEFELNYVTQLLDWADGNVSRAARKAGMDRMNLYRLIQRYGLRDPQSLRD